MADETLTAMVRAVDDGKRVDPLHDPCVSDLDALRAAPAKPKRYLLVVVGDVEPELLGPFDSDEERLEAARGYRRYRGDEDGLYRVDADDTVTVRAFTGGELATLTW